MIACISSWSRIRMKSLAPPRRRSWKRSCESPSSGKSSRWPFTRRRAVRLRPHSRDLPAHFGRKLHRHWLILLRRRRFQPNALEMMQNRIRQEPRQLRVRVPVAGGPFFVVVLEREAHLKEIARAGERDVEQPALFLDLLVARRGHVGRNISIGSADELKAVPLASLGRVNLR